MQGREGAYNCLRRTLDIGALIRQDDADLDLTGLQVTQADFEVALAQIDGRGRADAPSPARSRQAVSEARLPPGVH